MVCRTCGGRRVVPVFEKSTTPAFAMTYEEGRLERELRLAAPRVHCPTCAEAGVQPYPWQRVSAVSPIAQAAAARGDTFLAAALTAISDSVLEGRP